MASTRSPRHSSHAKNSSHGPTPKPRSYRVVEDIAAFTVRRGVRDLARQIGFGEKACEELVIVVSELSSNILKYGVAGTIEMGPVEDLDHGAGIQIVAEDETPPFDLPTALRDGHDARGQLDPAKIFRRGGIGAGMGAIVRFSHIIQMEPCPHGKRIRVVRFLRRPK